MNRTSRFFRHLSILLKPPKVKLQAPKAKVLLSRSKMPSEGLHNKLRAFLRHAILLLRPPKAQGERNKGPSRFKQMSFLLKKSRQAHDPGQRSSTRSAIVNLLEPPKFKPGELKENIKKKWSTIQVLFGGRPKSSTSVTDITGSRFAILLPALQEDVQRIRRSGTNLFRMTTVRVGAHWKTVSFCVLALTVMIEIALHTASFLAWSILEVKQQTAPAKEKVILTLGDSYTSGEFATYSTIRYSEEMERILRTQGYDGWKVRNVSAPTMSSTDAVHALPLLLKKDRPAIVYVMIGLNDYLTAPDQRVSRNPSMQPVSEEPWFRTTMLWSSLREHGFQTGLFDVIALPPRFARSEEWVAEGDTAVPVSEQEFLQLLQASERGDSGRKDASTEILSGFGFDTGGEFAGLSENHQPGWVMLRRGALDRAEAEFRAAIHRSPEDPLPHAGLVETYYTIGAHSRARKEVAWLMSRYQTNPEPIRAAALAYALPFETSVSETARITTDILERYPRNPLFWITLARCGFLSGRPTFATQAIDRALKLVPDGLPGLKASFLRARAELISETDPEAAVVSLMESYLLDHDEFLFIESVRNFGSTYLTVDRSKVAEKISASEEDKKLLEALLLNALDPSLIRKVSIIEANLGRLAQMCKEFKADVVFLTYPVTQPRIGVLTRRVAERTASRWLNLEAHFEILIKNDNEKRYMNHGRLTDHAFTTIATLLITDFRNNVHR